MTMYFGYSSETYGQCTTTTDATSGKCYWKADRMKNWQDAKAYCKDNGGNLVKLKTDVEAFIMASLDIKAT